MTHKQKSHLVATYTYCARIILALLLPALNHWPSD
jgi:hypothetical protein